MRSYLLPSADDRDDQIVIAITLADADELRDGQHILIPAGNLTVLVFSVRNAAVERLLEASVVPATVVPCWITPSELEVVKRATITAHTVAFPERPTDFGVRLAIYATRSEQEFDEMMRSIAQAQGIPVREGKHN